MTQSQRQSFDSFSGNNTGDQEQPEKIGSLWKKVSRKGVQYLTGVIDGKRVIIFRTREKHSEKSPDYIVLLSRPRNGGGQTQQAPDDDDQIPF